MLKHYHSNAIKYAYIQYYVPSLEYTSSQQRIVITSSNCASPLRIQRVKEKMTAVTVQHSGF